ncbi:unnamed protein product [Calicophoron daubneyi]|uniref:EF-hand domain-containing protein n=1 Tax=Calicophoron daubneyi TaxID=300641 RepID=A0AAV2U011_CALDB
MDAFTDAFIHIDERGQGVITYDELERYVAKNKLDKVMITRWKELFDPDSTGKITLEAFCDKLGLKKAAVIKQRNTMFGMGSDITVISADMLGKDQALISNETRRIVQNTDPYDPQAIIRQLKEFLDTKYGKTWQVAIVDGSYWISHDHIPANSFHFLFNGHAYLVWKIPQP